MRQYGSVSNISIHFCLEQVKNIRLSYCGKNWVRVVSNGSGLGWEWSQLGVAWDGSGLSWEWPGVGVTWVGVVSGGSGLGWEWSQVGVAWNEAQHTLVYN